MFKEGGRKNGAHSPVAWLSFKKLTAGGTAWLDPVKGLGNDVGDLRGKEQAIGLGWHLTNAP